MSKVAKAFGDFSSPVSVAMYAWQDSLRGRRKEKGCKTAREFSQLVKDATGVSIKHDVLTRIERCRQSPSATQFIAINRALTGQTCPNYPEFAQLAEAVSWLRRQEQCQ